VAKTSTAGMPRRTARQLRVVRAEAKKRMPPTYALPRSIAVIGGSMVQAKRASVCPGSA
jgi:hypothetical protein